MAVKPWWWLLYLAFNLCNTRWKATLWQIQGVNIQSGQWWFYGSISGIHIRMSAELDAPINVGVQQRWCGPLANDCGHLSVCCLQACRWRCLRWLKVKRSTRADTRSDSGSTLRHRHWLLVPLEMPTCFQLTYPVLWTWSVWAVVEMPSSSRWRVVRNLPLVVSGSSLYRILGDFTFPLKL